MPSRRHGRAGGVACLAAALWFVPTLCSADEEHLAPLDGIRTVSVSASIVAPADILPAGLTEKRLQTLVELKLRSWGLGVVPIEEDRVALEITPRVELDVTMLETRSVQKIAGYAFFTRLAVTEAGTSLRNGASTTTELWSQSFLNVSETKAVTADVERATQELLDQLVNEWLKSRLRH